MTIQSIILDIMEDERVTQNELSRKMGITRQALNQMLHSNDMKVSTMVMILTYLGYTFKIRKAGQTDE